MVNKVSRFHHLESILQIPGKVGSVDYFVLTCKPGLNNWRFQMGDVGPTFSDWI